MSLFASYERDFIAYIADINKKCAKIPDLHGGLIVMCPQPYLSVLRDKDKDE
jgi:hypothetical protein